MATPQLFGRDRELGVVHDLVDRAPERGGAIVVRGEAGIGKSSLLAAAGQRARERGMLVLTTSGVQLEAHLPFAGLQMLLRPIWSGVDDLPPPQRDAVLAAFGMTDTAAPDPFLIALATLDLLAETAAQAPLLLIVEDAQWGDRSTCNVLTFVARRLESEPIVMLFAVRDGFDTPLNQIDLPELRLGGLDQEAADALLDAHAPGLAGSVRERLLEEAAGNPLALVELHTVLNSAHRGGDVPLPAWLPLTTRLERAFTTRITDLPAATRMLLLVAAVNDGDAIAEVLAAGGALLDDAALTVEALEPAIAARLIAVDEQALRFRHPLVRSAIHQAASASQRQAAHAALAGMLAGQPDRRAWHRAASTTGPDAEVAADLEVAAARAQRRGALVVAVSALERAATLSTSDGDRGRRLLHAAELAFDLGRQDLVTRFVRDAEPLEHTVLDHGRIAWIKEMVDPRPPGDLEAMRGLIETARGVRDVGHTDLAVRLLLAAAARCTFADPGEDVREAIVAAAEQAGVPEDDPRLLRILVTAAPAGRGEAVLAHLAQWSPARSGDLETIHLAAAAGNAGAYDLSARLYEVSLAGLRTQGQLALLARTLVSYAWADAILGRCSSAIPVAEEGSRLARETGQMLVFGRGRVVEALLAGLRGDAQSATALALAAEAIARPLHATTILATAHLARGLTALGAADYTDAYEHLWPLFDPANPVSHYTKRTGAIGELAEAAMHCGQRDAVRSLMADFELHAAQSHSPWVHAGMRYARALLADDDDAEALFQAGLGADQARWPFTFARLQLAYGGWLRRQRRVTESRVLLRAARDAFDALGVPPWGERARQELRASGESSRRHTPDTLDLLTPQEQQIARMAADGLSNREIGQRLYLSHRTVGSHLYRIFPKLGITHRSELRGALDAGSPVTS